MLKLVEIKKDYLLKDQEPVHALKGISLNFRSNEFVAILGHSGCGKTTLLNIIGGLDHYDSGDLIIKGKSTKDFKDNDWDTYRNRSIGFVFQTYNLIPHQSILSNVELALTIAGLPKEERTKRAKEALDKVGLAGLYKKKPNQMSGGQMQRVAIARALVNNPEIVLADEPTGALDSETSIQIMDLLKEVAKDHLVIMVTHNPELADKYATRIVRMKDGEIYDDTNPYKGEYKEPSKVEEEPKKKKKEQSSMSFKTASLLSLSNLWSKFKRTALVVVAGSIGIIGVSTILGVSHGVNNYIDDMQEDMLSAYPVQIAEEAVDMMSLLTGLSNRDAKETIDFDIKTKVGMDSLIAYLLTRYADFTNIKTNDINEDFVKYINDMPSDYYSAVSMDYSIDPTNNFFTSFKKKASNAKSEVISLNGLTQQYIKTLMTVKGFSSYAQFVDLFTGFMKQLPAEKDYILSQYDLLGNSRFPEKENELLLVVDNKQTLTDLTLAQLGYYPQDQFLNVAKKAVKVNEIEKEIDKLKREKQTEDVKKRIKELEEELEYINGEDTPYPYDDVFDIDDILNHSFYYAPHKDLYKKSDQNCMVSHKQIDVSLAGSMDEGGSYYLSLRYNPEGDSLSGSSIEVDSLGEAKMHTILGYRFGEKSGAANKSELEGNWFMANVDELNMEDTEIISDILKMPVEKVMEKIKEYQSTFNKLRLVNFFTYNPTPVEEKERTVHFDTLGNVSRIDGSKFDPLNPYAVIVHYATLNKGQGIFELDPKTPDYYYEAVAEDLSKLQEVKVVGIVKAKPSTNFGTLNRGVYFTKAFAEKYMDNAKKSNIYKSFDEHIKDMRYVESEFNAYVQFEYDDYSLDEDNPETRRGYASALNGDQASTLTSIFASFLSSGTDNLKNDKLHLRALSGQKVIDIVDENDTSLIIGHEIKQLPQSISIYPKNFEKKDNVTQYLDVWNTNAKLPGISDERSEITYTDTIGMIINVISTLVEIVSIALISFTSLSLVVSCFMIAVITYISVMERIKEIGVIRSLGGRKKDVSRLFIAENITTGFASGLFGIIVTYILQVIINVVVSFFGVTGICALPWYNALLMIGIAMGLSILSGLIPSIGASKQDPVIALRTE